MPLPPRAAKIDVAAEQCGGGERTGDDHGFVLEAFVFEKSSGIGDVNGKVVQVRLGNRGADFFGVGDGWATTSVIAATKIAETE